jgi:hypothetical protein
MRRAFPAVLLVVPGKARQMSDGSSARERKARDEVCPQEGTGYLGRESSRVFRVPKGGAL